LDAAVERYRAEGFDVEYGRATRSYNALAYFADGSYLELLGRTGMPEVGKRLLRLFGKRPFADRLDTWDSAPEGLIGVALECADADELAAGRQLLADAGQGWFGGRSRRTDPGGRTLRFRGVMPDHMQIPIFGTCDTDLARPGFVHPNGVVGFGQVSFGTTEQLLPLVRRMCDDERLRLFVGEGVRDLEFAYVER
ncbi:MAG: VOC family protein, partial [Actinomycetota bacterium]